MFEQDRENFWPYSKVFYLLLSGLPGLTAFYFIQFHVNVSVPVMPGRCQVNILIRKS